MQKKIAQINQNSLQWKLAFREFLALHHPEVAQETIAHNGNSDLHDAAAKDNVAVVSLLSQGATTVLAQNNDVQTALHVAFLAKQQAVMKSIFAAASALPQNCLSQLVNLPDANGNTVLHLAADKLAHQFMTVFMNSDANILAQNNRGESALHILMNEKAKVLAEGSDDAHTAAAKKVDEAIANILQTSLTQGKLVDLINLKTEDGLTAIDLALVNSDPESMLALLTAANKIEASIPDILGAVDEEGDTVLHVALSSNPKAGELVQVLILTSPEDLPLAKNNKGQTAMHLAINGNYGACVAGLTFGAKKKHVLETLLNKTTDSNGITPLALAKQLGNTDIVSLFEEQLASLDETAGAAGTLSGLVLGAASDHKDDDREAGGSVDDAGE